MMTPTTQGTTKTPPELQLAQELTVQRDRLHNAMTQCIAKVTEVARAAEAGASDTVVQESLSAIHYRLMELLFVNLFATVHSSFAAVLPSGARLWRPTRMVEEVRCAMSDATLPSVDSSSAPCVTIPPHDGDMELARCVLGLGGWARISAHTDVLTTCLVAPQSASRASPTGSPGHTLSDSQSSFAGTTPSAVPTVAPTWLANSARAGHFVAEKPYLVRSTTPFASHRGTTLTPVHRSDAGHAKPSAAPQQHHTAPTPARRSPSGEDNSRPGGGGGGMEDLLHLLHNSGSQTTPFPPAAAAVPLPAPHEESSGSVERAAAMKSEPLSQQSHSLDSNAPDPRAHYSKRQLSMREREGVEKTRKVARGTANRRDTVPTPTSTMASVPPSGDSASNGVEAEVAPPREVKRKVTQFPESQVVRYDHAAAAQLRGEPAPPLPSNGGLRGAVFQVSATVKSDRKLITTSVEGLGGKLDGSSRYSPNADFLIVGDGAAERTEKYLAFLASRKPIVRSAYITESAKAGRFLDPAAFLAHQPLPEAPFRGWSVLLLVPDVISHGISSILMAGECENCFTSIDELVLADQSSSDGPAPLSHVLVDRAERCRELLADASSAERIRTVQQRTLEAVYHALCSPGKPLPTTCFVNGGDEAAAT